MTSHNLSISKRVHNNIPVPVHHSLPQERWEVTPVERFVGASMKQETLHL